MQTDWLTVFLSWFLFLRWGGDTSSLLQLLEHAVSSADLGTTDLGTTHLDTTHLGSADLAGADLGSAE